METKELTEKIGGVTLHYKWYPEEDLYSDGDVEDELLSIARNHTEEEYNQVIAQKKSWPVLYHFSEIRQNIVSWLPITKEHAVLEIGSGCGAITGSLARMAGSVTCVELSKSAVRSTPTGIRSGTMWRSRWAITRILRKNWRNLTISL